MAASTLRLWTTELVFPRMNRPRSLRSFIVRAIHWYTTPKEADSGFRWSATLWKPMAAKLAWKARRAKAANLSSHFRYQIPRFSKQRGYQHESGGASEVERRTSGCQDLGGCR